ncbi:MAG TPA: hypothetical protein VE547_10160 [Mycobacteriales bacterium]|nr:hypothetical protein [Mycobacteriales bacterium]
MYETGAPPAPPPLPDAHELVLPAAETDAPALPPAARPAKGYDATAVIAGLGGPPPGTVTYRLRGVETSQDG